MSFEREIPEPSLVCEGPGELVPATGGVDVFASGPPPAPDPADLSLPEKVERAVAAIRRLLWRGHPLAVGYSGGKDSSVMTSLVLEAAMREKEVGGSLPQILLTHARTGVDNPAMELVVRDEIERIRAYAATNDLPVRVDIVEPALNDSWAVRIISGRALPTFANSATRDCAIAWKLRPQQRQRKAVFQELLATGEPVVLVGTRFDESTTRAARMAARGEMDAEIWREEVLGPTGKVQRVECRLSPIAYWTQEDIWVFLSELGSGERASYTDAKQIWDVYRDAGNSSCVVVADDALKAGAKACGARFGCSLCAAVGRDKSLESMIESDPKYRFLLPLNQLQRFLVETQYDLDRREWVGRTIQRDGFIAVAPDSYSASMQRELLRYALTIDRDERLAAARLGIAPRFELVSIEQLIAIDAIWSIQGYHPRPFEAIHIWEDVVCRGRSFYPPTYEGRFGKTAFPRPKWLYVGSWDGQAMAEGFDPMYTGARHLLADLVGATERGGCAGNVELSSGHVVMDIEQSEFFAVDSEGAELFLAFEVLDRRIHDELAGADPGAAFRHYQMLGTISTARRHLGTIDDMLRRAAWKQRHGIFAMPRDELLARSVTDAERLAGMRSPAGVRTLGDELAERMLEERQGRAPRDRLDAPRQRGG